MIPDVVTVLGGIARALLTDLGPEVKTPYGALTVQLGAGLVSMIAQESDRAAARLVEENDAVSGLLHAGADVSDDTELSAALRAAPTGAPTSLLVSDLRRQNAALRALLTRLHAHLEVRADPPARALEDQIWTELAASTRRRNLDLAIG